MDTSENLCQRFRTLGYKITPQRRYIFRVLEGNLDHLSAEDVYGRVQAFVPDISLATVYNTLRELVQLGEIRELDLGEGKTRYDPNTGPHQHLICVKCRSVADVLSEAGRLELSDESRLGYRILGADITWYGICPACLATRDGEALAESSRLWGVSWCGHYPVC